MGKRTGNTIAEEVYQRLRYDILTSKHRPGSSLRLDRLKSEYGVGVTPLREALSRLVARGLVNAEGQKGARVANASNAELLDITAVRKEVEGLALRKSIELGDDYWESNLVAGRHRLILLERENGNTNISQETWETRHREFHELLIAGCNSPWLMHLTGILYDQFDRYRNLSSEYRLSDKPISLEHQQIMDAALARDAGHAVQLLHKHIDQAALMIVKHLLEPTERTA